MFANKKTDYSLVSYQIRANLSAVSSPKKKKHSESLFKVTTDVISINNSTEKTPDLSIHMLSYILNYRKNLYKIPISLKNN